MNSECARTIRKLREEKGLSQKQLGQKLYVNHSTVARWASASRLPDAMMILRLAKCLNVDVNNLFRLAARSEENPNVIIVDDNKIVLSDGLAVLDIELGTASGLDLCRTLIEINPCTNIVFLAAYADYSSMYGKQRQADSCSSHWSERT